MKPKHLPCLFAAAALSLSMGASAQTPEPTPAAKSPHAHPGFMAGHPKGGAAKTTQAADMKPECQAMMAKKQEMHDKHQAMDAALDKLVAEMNAAKRSKEANALEQPMAAVINELVSQRKAMHSMMMEMQPAMMAHVMGHKGKHGAKGAMECPMMKRGDAPETNAEEPKQEM